jgi:hypothetical protein
MYKFVLDAAFHGWVEGGASISGVSAPYSSCNDVELPHRAVAVYDFFKDRETRFSIP